MLSLLATIPVGTATNVLPFPTRTRVGKGIFALTTVYPASSSNNFFVDVHAY